MKRVKYSDDTASYSQKRDSFRDFGVLYSEGLILLKNQKEESMSNTSLVESLDYAGSGARYDKSAKRIMSFKSVLAWTLKSVCKEFSDLDLKYIERNCIGDVSISNKAVHQDHPDRKIKLGGDERVTASVGVSFKEGWDSLL